MNEDITDINEFRQRKDQKLLNNAESTLKTDDKRNRADKGTFLQMLGVAIFFDALQGFFLPVPIIGWIFASLIGLFAWLTFYLWSSLKGWGLSDTLKQIMLNWGLPIIEIIPILNALPTWTLKVVLTYSFLKAEDVLYNASSGRVDAEKLQNLIKRAA